MKEKIGFWLMMVSPAILICFTTYMFGLRNPPMMWDMALTGIAVTGVLMWLANKYATPTIGEIGAILGMMSALVYVIICSEGIIKPEEVKLGLMMLGMLSILLLMLVVKGITDKRQKESN